VAAAEVAQRLDGDVDADLVAVLEAIGDRLGRRVHADFDVLQPVSLDPFGQGLPGEARDPQAGMVEPGLARLRRQRDPHLGRRLRRQLVEAQRRQQAQHSAGNALRDLRERMRGGRAVPAHDVDTPGLARDLARAHQPVELCPRDALRLELGRARDAQAADALEDGGFALGGHEGG